MTSEYTALGQSQVVADSSQRLQELRTLWFDNSDGQIHAYNKEGRVFVELLGDVRSGTIRNQLGYEIVDVIRQANPADVSVGSSGISGGIFIEDSKITDAPIRRGRGESVTRGDRRRRELGLQSPSPPLTRPLRIHGAMTL